MTENVATGGGLSWHSRASVAAEGLAPPDWRRRLQLVLAGI
jgi:hypothetical protein